ncbi:NapC/NirT family cytochrome c [Desulforhopalus vacuolatus]|uniref:cytochrome c3 family protein n=1 Tax=Desulforhopalus vacuolatus TaxID=40414 RepID=UPI0019657901|nr:NapC/NirT family cytochrome c [Desulforhopalus vacuolatus]MBM9518713.1 NapC/NirT family cytochrome c [Desulforhopalus vacuolatus]
MIRFLLVVILGIIIGLGIALVSAEMIEKTADVEFCSSCHSMEGVVEAYGNAIHGGNNKAGFRAKCTACHLPHDNVLHYVMVKAESGMKDVLGEAFWVDSVDFVGNLKNREEFVYTSGCLQCHDMEAMKYDIPKAYLAHKDFKNGVVKSCVRCHENVGHKNIKDHLVKNEK